VCPEAGKDRPAGSSARSGEADSRDASSGEGSLRTERAKVREAALRFLSVRARSTRELEGRLREKGFDSKLVSDSIQWLRDRRYLDDEEFAAAFIRDRLRFSPRSPFLLKRELGEKGVSESLAHAVLDRILEEDGWTVGTLAARAAEGWVRKQGPEGRRGLLAPRFTRERERARRRLYGFLARRGFVGEALGLGMEAGERVARERTSDAAPPHDSTPGE